MKLLKTFAVKPIETSHFVSTPCAPIVAMKAKASITPPNCARTLLAESTVERSIRSGLSAQQREADDGAEHGAENGGERRDPDRGEEVLQDDRIR